MRVLVTGGSGFIGGAIAKKLSPCVDNDDLLIYDIVEPDCETEFVDANHTKLHCDLIAPFDLVFHCAGLLGTRILFERVVESVKVNILGMLELLELQRNHGLIYCAGLVDNWLNPYMITKYAAERFALMYREWYGTKVSVVRMPHIYGPGQSLDQEKIIPTFIMQALKDQPITINGSGKHRVQLLYVDDAAEVFLRLAEESIGDPLIDITSLQRTNSLTVLEVARLILDMTDSRSDIEHMDMRRGQPENITHTPIDMHQTMDLYNHLGIVETPFEKGMEKTIEYYKDLLNVV